MTALVIKILKRTAKCEGRQLTGIPTLKSDIRSRREAIRYALQCNYTPSAFRLHRWTFAMASEVMGKRWAMHRSCHSLKRIVFRNRKVIRAIERRISVMRLKNDSERKSRNPYSLMTNEHSCSGVDHRHLSHNSDFRELTLNDFSLLLLTSFSHHQSNRFSLNVHNWLRPHSLMHQFNSLRMHACIITNHQFHDPTMTII